MSSGPPPLPVVPPRLPAEALGSWLGRVAAVYEIDAHGLLDEWAEPLPQAARQRPPSVEARLTRERLYGIAPALRVPATELAPLLGPWPDWLLHSETDVAVCPLCLIDDDRHRRVRHRRLPWVEAWRVTCETHRRPLVHLPAWPTADLRVWTRKDVSQRTALGQLVWQARRPVRGNAKRPSISVAMRALGQIERAIGSALVGRSPRADDWGGLDAQAFLRVVRDVTSFALTNFSDKPWAPICTMDLHRFADQAPIRCFARPAGQYGSRPGQPVDLVWAGNAGLRRCALFWARELMHAHTARPWLANPLKQAHTERQRLILQRQTSDGLAWLAARMREWPADYRQHWWAGMRHVFHHP